MSFFSSLWKTALKIAPVAIGYAFGGPLGAAVGGAAGSALRGGDIGQIIQGGLYGYGGGTALNALGSAAAAYGGVGATGPVVPGMGSALSSLGQSAAGALPSGLGGSGSNFLQLANLGSSAYNAIAGQGAAQKAAGQQIAALNKAQALQQATMAQANANVAPYMQAGGQTVAGLSQLVNDPNAQKAFITNNPFYDALATRAKENLFSKAAASGKMYSGGTAEALQNSLLLLGNDLLNTSIGQRQTLANTGLNATNSINQLNQTGGALMNDLTTSVGQQQAAGTIGGYNAVNQALTGGITTAGQLAGLINNQQDPNRIIWGS